MSSFIIRGQHASRYISDSVCQYVIHTRGGSRRVCSVWADRYRKPSIAAEAFHKAVDDLKKELKITDDSAAWASSHADVERFIGAAQQTRKTYDDASNHHSETRAWLERCSSRVMYYGKVFDTLAQHHPEYVALVWGAVKLVLIGIINRATLVEKLAQAFVAIGDVLPRSNLSAELYQTDHMRDALSRLYAYIIVFLQLCVKWYNRSSLGRLWSALKAPFELDYQCLVDQIKLSSAAVEDVANAGARVEIRDIRTIQDLHHAQFVKFYNNILDRQAKLEESMTQLVQVATSSNTLTQRISIDVRDMSATIYRLEFHQIVEFLAPIVPPQAALLKVQSFARRNLTTSLPSLETLKTKRMLAKWASVDRSCLLVVRVDLSTQKQARDIAADTIQVLASQSQCVFWNLSLPRISNEDDTMAGVFKALAHQALQHSPDLFAEFAEQLNLTKMHSTHTDNEWADLICLLLSKKPRAFVILETGSLHKAYRNDPNWANRLLELLHKVAKQSTAAGNKLKILILMHGKISIIPSKSSDVYELLVTSLSLPSSTSSQSRRVAQRSRLSMKRRMQSSG